MSDIRSLILPVIKATPRTTRQSLREEQNIDAGKTKQWYQRVYPCKGITLDEDMIKSILLQQEFEQIVIKENEVSFRVKYFSDRDILVVEAFHDLGEPEQSQSHIELLIKKRRQHCTLI